MVLYNVTKDRVLATNAALKMSFWGRLVGVIGQNMAPDHAVGIDSCDWVHTWFVRGPLDLLYCDRVGHVLFVCRNLPPFRLGRRCPGAFIVWELPGGTLAEGCVSVGDTVRMIQ